MTANPNSRLKFIGSIIVLVGLIFGARLSWLQLVEGEEYRAIADRQSNRPESKAFDRGSIFFKERDGDLVSAATLQSGFILTLNPTLIENQEETWIKLSSLVTLDRETFLAKANRVDDTYEEFPELYISEATADQIEALALKGIGLRREQWRFYPGGRLASHIIGLVGYDEEGVGGRYGLESYYNDVLERGEPRGNFASFLGELFGNVDSQNNRQAITYHGDVITAIEPAVQKFLERELATVQQSWQGKVAGGVIMEPTTGRVIALGASPDFDPAQPVENLALLTNPLVENVYELGSIMKPLTLAAAFDAGVLKPDSTYFDAGYLTLDGRRINNYDNHGRGEVSMQEVINHSLNTGAVHAMQKIGEQKFADYLTRYGLGDQSGIDLPNEASGLLGNLASRKSVELATASFGQGIAVSPIAMTRALASLAAKGMMPSPYIAESIRYLDNETESTPRREPVRVISETAATQMTTMLVKAVDEALAGGTKKLEHYSVAAKTGTAQLPRDDGPGYRDDKYLHSFFGYFPASDPRFIVFLYQAEPAGARFSSETLTDPFMSITKFLLNYYQIPPDR